MLDYLNGESEEIKEAFAKIGEAERALLRADRAYRPSIMGERYLTGEEICKYLHISPRTLQTLRDKKMLPYTIISERVFLYPETGIRDLLGRNLQRAARR